MPLHILTANDVREALPMPDAIDAMRKAFGLLADGQAEVPLRTAVEIPNHDAVTLFMPAYLHVGNRMGSKIVSVFPHNGELNLPTIHAVVVLINAATGEPQALLEGSALTAIRTGAVSGLATDLLARPDASTAAIIGAGVQARTQLEAICCVRSIQHVRVYSRTRARAERFADEMAGQGPIPSFIEVMDSAHDAAHQADIICAATPASQPLIGVNDVKPGAHVNAIGSFRPDMCEVDPELIRNTCVVVDQREAALNEAGELIACLEQGLLQASDLIELGELVNGAQPARSDDAQITFFKSVGLAIQDIAAGQQAYTMALQKKLGTSIQL
jgi:ornithine cyclodeaminase